MSSSENSKVVYTISLIAGVLILVNGLVLGGIGFFITQSIPDSSSSVFVRILLNILNTLTGIINAVTGIISTVTSILNTLMVVGIISGIIVIVAAVMSYKNPARKTLWGITLLVFSSVSIIIGGGFLLGLILGINGGILTLVLNPKGSTV